MAGVNGFGGMNLFGGLAQGFAQGQQMRLKREEDKENKDLQKQMLKMQMEALKVKSGEQKQKQTLMNMLIQGQGQGQQPPQPQGTPMSQSFNDPMPGDVSAIQQQPAPSVTGQMAGMQTTGGMDLGDPRTQMLLKASGIDMTGIGGMIQRQGQHEERLGQQKTLSENRLAETIANNKRADEDRDALRKMQASEIITFDSELPDGTIVQMARPKYPSAAGGEGMALPQLKKTVRKRPPVETHEYIKDGITYSVIRNKRTGEELTSPIPIKPPATPAAETASKIALAERGRTQIPELRDLLYEDGEDGKPVVNKSLLLKIAAPFGGIGEGRTFKAKFMDTIDARIRAATGAAVTKEEWPAYFQMYLPSILDNDSLVKDKLDRLDNFLQSYLITMDPSGAVQGRIKAGLGSDTPVGATPNATQAPDKPAGIPDVAAKSLVEGKETVFKNGQVWTLRGGQPVRVE